MVFFTTSDHYIYIRFFLNDYFIILLLYVDNMLIIGQDTK